MSRKALITLLIMASASLVGAQQLQTLFSFSGTNGANPEAALTLGNDGNFYGTTFEAVGNGDYGTVFKVTTNGALTTLVPFTGGNGANPKAGLTLGNDGNFYGTTFSGNGTVFKMTPNGTFTTLVLFSGTNGAYPQADLRLGKDGNFYGTTFYGGSGNKGTLFKVTPDGALTTLVVFATTNGANPQAALTLGSDGDFYGTTYNGGITNYPSYAAGLGSVFKVTTNGTLTTLVFFGYTNGANPKAALTLGNDGGFYGTTYGGGSHGDGTVFRVTTNGTLTTLFSFTACSASGASPAAALTLGSDGAFYGTTYLGATSRGYGTAFRVTTNGTLTTLVTFDGSNGETSVAALTVGNDGNFYGTTEGNPYSCCDYGTVFRLLLPPVISVHPESQTNVAGTMAQFVVSATSLIPMNFQWQKNGTNLLDGGRVSGATTNTLTITGLSQSDAAIYSVVVSNANFGVTNYATLTVIDPPGLTAQPTNLLVFPGTNVAFAPSLTGSASFFRYQWQFNGISILNATNPTFTISSAGTNNAGNYSVVITNAAGTATSSNASLTVVLSPKSQTNYASSTATLSATAFTPASLNYQWQKNGTVLVDGANLSGTTNSTLTIANVSDADAAIYNAVVSNPYGSLTTSNAVLTVNDLPFIVSPPQSQIVLAGSNVTFTVTVYGASPFVFQWYFNGALLGSPESGANSSSFTLNNVGTNQAGNYWVQVVNGYGSLTSGNATLAVVALPPTITMQPGSRTNKAGTTATFSIAASSLSPISYQWQKNSTNLVNGANLSGATNSTLTIASVSDNDAAI